MSISTIIPAQETNKYHVNGDLAPFGENTLLEWKIMQCRSCINHENIFISTASEKVSVVAKKYGVKVLLRKEGLNFSDAIIDSVAKIPTEHVMLTNPTSPFINDHEYTKIINTYLSNLDKYDSLITTNQRNDFSYYNKRKLNFDCFLGGMDGLLPIHIVTNGAYITSKNNVLKDRDFIGKSPYFYNLDFLESLEAKDEQTFAILSELISIYFKKELNVYFEK